jgi:hypothetical protein
MSKCFLIWWLLTTVCLQLPLPPMRSKEKSSASVSWIQALLLLARGGVEGQGWFWTLRLNTRSNLPS